MCLHLSVPPLPFLRMNALLFPVRGVLRLLHVSVVRVCLFVYMCKRVCQSEDMVREEVLLTKLLLADVFSQKRNHFHMMGGASKMSSPTAPDPLCDRWFPHLPCFPPSPSPSEWPRPQDALWPLTLWPLCRDCEVRASQVLGVFADGGVSGNREAWEGTCAR